ncbi:AraC family transcriptional regulator [soil metagenome]
MTLLSADEPAAQLRFGPGAEGIERMEATFRGGGFEPHRHDRYAIGVTLHGVQSFQYRGSQHWGLPGEGHILHPDELHDGVPGTEAGLRYRIVYVDPALIHRALGGGPLPYVADPVVSRRAVAPALISSLRDLDEPLTELAGVELVTALADSLQRDSSDRPGRRGPLAVEGLERVRELITDDPGVQHSAAEFEALSGLTRWEVARQFRAAFGTSPTQFRIMRQLDRARALLQRGDTLATVAAEAGFADQSHLSRLFKRTYGITAAAWRVAVAQPFTTSGAVHR